MGEDTEVKDPFTAEDHHYRAILKSRQCACGEPKRIRDAFCPYCYKALPKEQKSAVNYIIRYGFAEGYEEALEYLKKAGRIQETEE